MSEAIFYAKLIELRRRLHRRPELSNREFLTSGLLFEQLTALGLFPEYIDQDNTTGVWADIDSGQAGPLIIYRADIDALPIREKTELSFASEHTGVMHACGHDLHMTVLIGVAEELIRRKSEWCGRIRLILQEGEENLSGANKVIERGLLTDVDFAVTLHTWPDLHAGTVGLRKGASMASTTGIKVIVKGHGGHGAHPHRSTDPIAIASYLVTAAQSIVARNVPPLDPAVITFGSFHAGEAPNIIPEEAVLEGTVRTLSDETYQLMHRRLPLLIEKQAESFGGTATVELKQGTRVLISDPRIVDIFLASANHSIGSEQVCILEQPSMGSEDFALYLARIPGCLVRLGTGSAEPTTRLPLHHPEVTFDEKAIPTGVIFMTQALIELSNSDWEAKEPNGGKSGTAQLLG